MISFVIPAAKAEVKTVETTSRIEPDKVETGVFPNAIASANEHLNCSAQVLAR